MAAAVEQPQPQQPSSAQTKEDTPNITFKNGFRYYPHINIGEIPRLSKDDPKVDSRITDGLPVVITDTELVRPAIVKWDIDYLLGNIGDNPQTVCKSNTEKFKYFDDKKLLDHKDFVPPMKREDILFRDFVKAFRSWKRGDERLYLQQPLNDSVGPAIVRDFLSFNWLWCNGQQTRNKWAGLSSNLLLIGHPGNITPVHYDEQENFFAQVRGRKRFLLFSPDNFECLYPHPFHHPCDRQSQVDFDKPDYTRFPKFKNAKGIECILSPGDVLYLPSYWWHYVECCSDDECNMSINFWYKNGPTEKVVYPLQSHQKVAMTRNIERIITEALQDWREVGPFFRNITLGRYTED